MIKYEARIVGERSAGQLVLQIYVNDELYWSNSYFAKGASNSWYAEAMRQIIDDAEACNEVMDWAEWGYEDGKKVIIDHATAETTYVVASYTPEGGWVWPAGYDDLDGQSRDIVKYNLDRVPAELALAANA